MGKENRRPKTVKDHLKDMRRLLDNPEFGIGSSPEARPVVMMFEFLLRKIGDLEEQLKVIKKTK